MGTDKMKLSLKILAVLALCSLLLSCNSLDNRNTVFFISLHEVVPTPEQYDGGMVMVVKTADGLKEKHVRTIPITNSAYIYKIEVIPGKEGGRCGLRLFFDEVAKGLWLEAFHYRRDRQIAVVVDGFLVGFSNISSKRMEEGVLELDPLWNKLEAEAIAAKAKHNHDLFDVRPFRY